MYSFLPVVPPQNVLKSRSHPKQLDGAASGPFDVPGSIDVHSMNLRPQPLPQRRIPSMPDNDSLNSDPESTTSSLFPPVATPAPPSRERCPPGKRRSQGYIPRPPNTFMLFCADFVHQKHVPGSIETNHGSLSKIIGEFLIHLILRFTAPSHYITTSMQLLVRSTSGGEACLGGHEACQVSAACITRTKRGNRKRWSLPKTRDVVKTKTAT